MNVHMKSMMRCMKFQSFKKPPSNMEKGTENVTAKTTNSNTDKKNENSPKSCREYLVPNNHSTPIRQKHNSDNAEDSCNLDYSPNLILLPCTQDGGNEVAWDWQSTLNKTPHSRSNKQIVQSETPKGTRPFHRKRNSDSPLLCKPLKRKTIKMESEEHMGQFAAELQALDEKVRIIQQTDQNDLEVCNKEEPTATNTSNDDEVKTNVDNKENCATETNVVSKRSLSYDDLFDDSIDDSMARCTQEIEEKLNLVAVKGSFTVYSQADIKKEKLSTTDNTAAQTSAGQSKESSIAALTKNLLHKDASNDSSLRINDDSSTLKRTNEGTLKTYSKLPLRRDTNSSVLVSTWKDKELRDVCLNNMVPCDTEKSYDDKKSPKDNIAELFNFSDDSFDDCLATCIEDGELLSTDKSSGFSVPKFESNYKCLTFAFLKRNPTYNSATPKAKVETSTTGSLDNRKFFKSKSLSDQYIGQNTSVTNFKSAAHVTHPSYPAKSASHSSSTVSHRTSAMYTSVNADSVSTNDRRKIKDNAMPSANRTQGSDINRPAVKEGGTRFVRYNSTGNMRNDTKELVKINSLPTRCTAEEIEKKRLQAKMRLEARRKLYALNVKNNINR